jgi:VWFA-related protein
MGAMFDRCQALPFTLLLTLGVCGIKAPAVYGQTSPSPQAPPSIAPLRVTARLVVLDVVVVDAAGHVVPNLDKSQFTVTEDKVAQTIRNFENPTDHAMPPSRPGQMLVRSSADLPKIGTAPVNVLVIDELNTPYLQIAQAQEQMRRFLEKQPEVLPAPTMFVASGASRITVLHDFTQSRADLLASVRQHVTEADFDALVNQLNGGKTGSQNGFAKTLGALSQIASSLRGIPGHKNVIWVGTGYNNAYDLLSASQSDAGTMGAAVKLVTDRMLEARITLSTIDPAGVMRPVVEDQSQEADAMNASASTGGANMAVSFDTLARSTGGAVLSGRNDLDKLVDDVASEQTQYYTLTYAPTNHSDDGRPYRQIRVTLKDPALHATTRTGYFVAADEVSAVAPNTTSTQPQQLKFDLATAARTTLVYTGLHMQASRNSKGYTLLIAARDLQWSAPENDARTATVTMLVVCYDAKNKELAQHASQLKEQIGAGDDIQNGANAAFAFPFALPSGTARIRFVARDAATGALGSINVTP